MFREIFNTKVPVVEDTWDTSIKDIEFVLERDDVRITPGRISFVDAYEGKEFTCKVVIQNCGKNLAFLRIGSPSSFAFSITPIESRGETVSPGLMIKRTIKYKYTQSTAVPFANIPIFINDKEVILKIKISVLCSIISVDKFIIEFGQIDVGPTPTTRVFNITNSGSKNAKFAIDLGQNEQKIIVTPIKGVVEARSAIKCSVEIVSFKEGEFDTEFWIKCYKPIRIRVTGCVKMGDLEICNSDIARLGDFLILDFPRTYYGARTVRRLILKNNSSSRSIFCVLGEVNHKRIDFKEARKLSAYNSFDIRPSDGRIGPKEAIILTITFAPTIESKHKISTDEDDHRFCICKIKKLNYAKDMNINDYPGGLFSTLTELVQTETDADKQTTAFIESGTTNFSSKLSNGESNYSLTMEDIFGSIKFESLINLCLHGDVEHPSVTVIPSQLSLKKLVVNVPTVRVLQYRNNSKTLKICVAYQKQAFIEFKPKFVTIPPQSTEQIEVIITPAKFGKVECIIELDMLSQDQPRYQFENYCKVGSISVPIKFSVPTVTTVPKRNLKCCPNQKQPVDVPIYTNPVEKVNSLEEIKTIPQVSSKVKSYVKISRDKQMFEAANLLPEYSSNAKGDCCNTKLKGNFTVESPKLFANGICPLTPSEINNIIIDPMHLNIGKVAAYSQVRKTFRVVNNNENAITICVVPEKRRFVFPEGDVLTIQPHQDTTIPFNFFSEFEGLHSLCIRIVINNSHIVEATMAAQVVRRALSLSTNRINFSSNEPLLKYMDISNTLNVPLAFTWDLSNSNCMIKPAKGIVNSGREMTCTVEFPPNVTISNLQDVSLITEGLHRARLYLVMKTPKLKLELSEEAINFGTVGLNMLSVKKLVLKNVSAIPIEFKIPHNEPIDGLLIAPKNGIIPSKGVQIFKAYLQCKETKRLNIYINIVLNRTEYLQFQLYGNVVMPKLSIKPASIHFRKIPDTAVDTACFTIQNKGQIPTCIAFPMKRLNEWKIYNGEKTEIIEKPVILPGGSYTNFWIEYSPINTTNHWFYLPLTINYCLGDVEESLLLQSRSRIRSTITIPTSVPHLKICNVAYESKFEMSKILCNFAYYPFDESASITTDSVCFMNKSSETIELCIRLDDLDDPFTFTPLDCSEVTQERFSYRFTIQSGQEICFISSYKPQAAGSHKIRLPLFLHEDHANTVHNYITLAGFYQEALISAKDKIYFGVLPLRMRMDKEIEISRTYHGTNCRMSFQCNDVDELLVSLHEEDGESQEVSLKLSYTSSSIEVMKGTICLYCSCGGNCTIEVFGGIENSILSNYPFIGHCLDTTIYSLQNITTSSSFYEPEVISNTLSENLCSYPYFPEPTSKNYDIFNYAVLAVEDWLFDFIFNGLVKHTVPYSLRHIPPCEDTDSYVEHDCYIPYMQILLILGGTDVVSQFNIKIYSEPTARAKSLYCIYRNVKEYLLEQEGFIPHIDPKYLLDYEDYLVYCSIENIEADNTCSEDTFNSISQQSWLDVLLQTIKIFVVGKIEERETDNLKDKISEDNHFFRNDESLKDIHNFYMKTVVINKNFFSDSEGLLLNWLQYNFYAVIDDCCPTNIFYSQSRFDTFNSCIDDSICLITTVIRYCPYLKESLLNIVWEPSTDEQYFHNAAKLLQTLTRVNCCFSILPEQIRGKDIIKKLLFVTYLYDFLPSLQPQETIECESPLSKSMIVKLSIHNGSDLDCEYKAIIFGDESKSFTLQKDTITVAAGKTVLVNMQYFARYAKYVSCTLLLSGELRRKRLSRSYCYFFKGIPDVTYMSSSFTMPAALYTTFETDIEVKCPYSTPGTFEIWYSHGEPTTVENLKLIAQKERSLDYEPEKINSFETDLTFDETLIASWHFMIVCLASIDKHSFFFLRNAEVGEFAVGFSIECTAPRSFETIDVNVPLKIAKKHCICYNGPNYNCLRYVRVKIPRKNEAFNSKLVEIYTKLRAIMHNEVMVGIEDPNTRTRILLHMIHSKSDKTAEISLINRILTDPTTYTVSIAGDSSDNLRHPETFHIASASQCGTEPMLMHVDGPLRDGILLNLMSTDKTEWRVYKLFFREKRKFHNINII